jgi:hypothetical protein
MRLANDAHLQWIARGLDSEETSNPQDRGWVLVVDLHLPQGFQADILPLAPGYQSSPRAINEAERREIIEASLQYHGIELIDEDDQLPCQTCEGSGRVVDDSGNLPNGQTAGPFVEYQDCPECSGGIPLAETEAGPDVPEAYRQQALERREADREELISKVFELRGWAEAHNFTSRDIQEAVVLLTAKHPEESDGK